MHYLNQSFANLKELSALNCENLYVEFKDIEYLHFKLTFINTPIFLLDPNDGERLEIKCKYATFNIETGKVSGISLFKTEKCNFGISSYLLIPFSSVSEFSMKSFTKATSTSWFSEEDIFMLNGFLVPL